MTFNALTNSMDAVLFNEFGEPATYSDGTNTKTVLVVIDKDLEQFGSFDTNGPARRHEVSFLTSDIASPKRGHTLVAGLQSFVFDGAVSNDGNIARWHINEA